MIMAGDGPERRRIESLIHELGLSNRVELVGMVPHERALEIIAGASVAMFTGMREEGGLALAEAMLLGTPVVVLSNGGATAIASAATDPSKVSLVEPAGPHATAERMAAAIDHHISLDRSVSEPTRPPLIDQDAAIERLQTLVQAAVSGRRWSNT
jgi:glycosyltransferase involved in cell wall biosynthesis